MNKKSYVAIYTKKQYSRFEIPEMVGIFYAYHMSIKQVIDFWILPEFRNQVYGKWD